MKILTAIARTAARLCEAHDAQIYLVEGAVMRLVALHGAFRPARPLGEPFPVSRGDVQGRAVLTRRVVHVRDLKTAVRTQYPELAARQRATGTRTILAAPLLSGGLAVGVISIRRARVNPFTSRQIALLRTFADQAVIAIENERLVDELGVKNDTLAEALAQQAATGEILRAISSSPTDLQPVLDTVVKAAARFCGAYDVCIFHLDGDHLRLDAHHGPVAQPDGFLLPVVKGSVGGRTVLEGRVIHVADLPAETAEFPEAAANARRLGFRTILSVPLIREGVAIGVIQLRRAEASAFTDKQITLLQTFADQAVIAIENVRLFTELQEKNGALTGSLERQTATGEVLRAIAHTQTDAQPVFDAIVQSAARLCRAHTTAVFLTDGQTLSHPANYGGPPDAMAAARARYPLPVDMDTAPGMAVLTRSIVHVADSEAPSVVEPVRQVGRVLGFRSVVIVPMLHEGGGGRRDRGDPPGAGTVLGRGGGAA